MNGKLKYVGHLVRGTRYFLLKLIDYSRQNNKQNKCWKKVNHGLPILLYKVTVNKTIIYMMIVNLHKKMPH